MDSSDLQLKRIAISNFKSLKKAELDHLNNLTVLMGRNNAGKSNLLDAVNFLHDASVDLPHALKMRGGKLSEIIFRKREDLSMEFQIGFKIPPSLRSPWIHELFGRNSRFNPDAALASHFMETLNLRVQIGADSILEEITVSNVTPGARPCLVLLNRRARDRSELVGGRLEHLCAEQTSDLPYETHLLHTQPGNHLSASLSLGRLPIEVPFPVSSQIGEAVARQFASIEWIDPHRNMPEAAPIHGECIVAPNASNLPDVLHWLFNNRPAQFRKIENEIRKLIPHLGRLYTPTVQNTATLGLLDNLEEELSFTINQMSFGTKSAIAIITKVALARPGAWLTIEEPETYLHPAAQIALFDFLRRESTDKRLFIATHSTALAASCPIDSLYIIGRDADNASVVEEVTEKEAHHVIEQLGVKPSFSFESDAIVFVERPEAAPLLEAWAKRFSFHARIQFLDAESGNTLHFFANARIALSKFVHTQVYLILQGKEPPDHAATARRRILNHLKMPVAQVVTLQNAEIEMLLLDARAILRAFPSIQTAPQDLESRLAQFRTDKQPRKGLNETLQEGRLGKYDPSFGARIAEAMETIPPEIETFFKRVDENSKPFWKI